MGTWSDRFAESVKRHLGKVQRRKVMKGSENLPSGSSSKAKKERAAWLKEAISTLDGLTEPKTACAILVDTCPHKYPKKRIQEMRKQYEDLGNIDRLIEVMRSDTSYGGGSFYDYPRRDGDTIHVTKVPFSPKKYAEATTDAEKRSRYCHCSLVRDSIGEISATFCCCSGGWVKQLWEGVLGIPLEVTLTESLLRGADKCTHSFRIPSELF